MMTAAQFPPYTPLCAACEIFGNDASTVPAEAV